VRTGSASPPRWERSIETRYAPSRPCILRIARGVASPRGIRYCSETFGTADQMDEHYSRAALPGLPCYWVRANLMTQDFRPRCIRGHGCFKSISCRREPSFTAPHRCFGNALNAVPRNKTLSRARLHSIRHANHWQMRPIIE